MKNVKDKCFEYHVFDAGHAQLLSQNNNSFLREIFLLLRWLDVCCKH